jgi:ankyrin repeat protein
MAADDPLTEAAKRGDAAEVRRLIEAGELSTRATTAALLAFAERDDEAVALLLLEAGADPNCARADGGLPLVMCAVVYAARCAALLLDHGARIDDTTCEGICPLCWAAGETGLLAFVSLLLQRGAAVDMQGARGVTALYRACRAACAQPCPPPPRDAHVLHLVGLALLDGASHQSSQARPPCTGAFALAQAAQLGSPEALAALNTRATLRAVVSVVCAGCGEYHT